MEKKPELRKPSFIKISEILPGAHCYHVYGKVVKATHSELKRISGDLVKIVDGVIADESGSANFHFEGPNADLITQGIVVAVRNGRSEVVEEHIRLELDKFGKLTKEDSSLIKSTNEKNNISDVSYEKRKRGSDSRGRD